MDICEMIKTGKAVDFIETKIKKVVYHKLADTFTICVLTLENGFTVTGEGFCINPNTYDETVSKIMAYDEAEAKVLLLESYLAKEKASND